MNSEGKQTKYITLAQSSQSAYHFRPVEVNETGQVRSLPVSHRSTIRSMAAVCKAYSWKYGIPVLFRKHLATLPIPEPVRSQIEALILAEVEEVYG